MLHYAYPSVACFAHCQLLCIYQLFPCGASEPNSVQTCSDLSEAVHRIASKVEVDLDSFALADAAVPVVVPAMDAGIVDTVLCGPDKD